MKNVVIGIVLVAVLGVGGYMVMSKNPATTTEEKTESKTESMNEKSTGVPSAPENTAPGAVKEFTVTASEFAFDVKNITVKKGDTVKITLKNSGKYSHDFAVDEFNARTKVIKNGETDSLIFVADKTGTFEYYCGVMKHRVQGQVGKLVVEE